MNDIILVSKNKNKFNINKKISINISIFIKNIIDDNEDQEILLIQFNDLEIKLFQDYINHLSKNNYNYNEYYETIEYYMGENSNKNIELNCNIINNFIKEVKYPNTKSLYKLIHFLDIELLQEILIKFNLNNIIKNNLTIVDNYKNICDNLNDEKKEMKEEFKEFISNNDDLEIYSDVLDNLSDDEDEDDYEDEDEDEDDEPLKKKKKIVEKFPKEINNNIKNYNCNLKSIKKKYIMKI